MSLNERSLANLQGVHTDLVRVVARAAQIIEELEPSAGFIVTEGLRSLLRQEQLVKAGASRTMRSRHLTGHAVDLAVEDGKGGVRWDRPAYEALAAEILAAAKAENVPVEWGGHWRGFFDGPHFQLPWRNYPA